MALARAIVPRPGILLMDEPFSGLDSRLRDSVRADTLSVLREAGATARHRHARPGGGDAHQRPHRLDARRPDRPAGRRARALRPAAEPFRRTLLQPSERARRGRCSPAAPSPASATSRPTASATAQAVMVAIRPQGVRLQPARNREVRPRRPHRVAAFSRRDRAFRRGGGGCGVLSRGKGARRRRARSGRRGAGRASIRATCWSSRRAS